MISPNIIAAAIVESQLGRGGYCVRRVTSKGFIAVHSRELPPLGRGTSTVTLYDRRSPFASDTARSWFRKKPDRAKMVRPVPYETSYARGLASWKPCFPAYVLNWSYTGVSVVV